MFHPVTYDGGPDIKVITDPVDLRAIETQVSEFGQTPKQLFVNPHPKRYSSKLSEICVNLNIDKMKSSLTSSTTINNLYIENSPVKEPPTEKKSFNKLASNSSDLNNEIADEYSEKIDLKMINYQLPKRDFNIKNLKFHKK